MSATVQIRAIAASADAVDQAWKNVSHQLSELGLDPLQEVCLRLAINELVNAASARNSGKPR